MGALTKVISGVFSLGQEAVKNMVGVVQRRYSDENYVRLSVCLSVTRVILDKTEERSVQIFTPYERTFSLVL